MADEKPKESKEPKAAPSGCCHILASIIDYAAESERKVTGLQVAHMFDRESGKHTWSPIVYILPSKGRGKKQKLGLTAVMVFCPFCGTKQPGRNG